MYKLAAIEDAEGNIIPKIKISENVEKITTPHFKQVWRLIDNTENKYVADVLTLRDEVIDPSQPYTIFDPTHTWKKKTLTDFRVEKLQEPIFEQGVCVYKQKSIEEIRAHCAKCVSMLWSEILRFENPHPYYVDLSQKLWDLKIDMLQQH